MLTPNIRVSEFEILNPRPQILTILKKFTIEIKIHNSISKKIKIRIKKSKIDTKNKQFDPQNTKIDSQKSKNIKNQKFDFLKDQNSIFGSLKNGVLKKIIPKGPKTHFLQRGFKEYIKILHIIN